MKFIRNLLHWYDTNQRDLPWRKTKSFYNIWVCEIIFQQTRINQGLEYYYRFLEKFPDVKTLATASEQEVLALWQGLGYYSRARNIHYSAKEIVLRNRGKFPENYDEIIKLKGIGKYTAAAIASICYDEKVPAIDGNALRVYARLFNDYRDISEMATFNAFFNLIQPQLQNIDAGNYNQAIMELGAMICTPKNPKCEDCPIATYCLAFAENNQENLPVKSSKTKVKNETYNYYFINHNSQFFAQKRTENGIWKNMYEFSTQNFDLKSEKVFNYNHKLTHKNLIINIHCINCNIQAFKDIASAKNFTIIDKENYQEFPFPVVLQKFLLAYYK